MKIEVKNNDSEKKYPCICIDSEGDICIFIEENKGFWLFMNNSNKPTGEMDFFDSKLYSESDFEPFNGTITLSND